MLKWIVSVLAGLGLTVYAGGYTGMGPDMTAALAQFAFAAVFVGVHVFIWRGAGLVTKVLRFLVWAFYAGVLAAFLVAYFPRGVFPMLKLMGSNITLPMVLGFLAIALPARIRRAKRVPEPALPSRQTS